MEKGDSDTVRDERTRLSVGLYQMRILPYIVGKLSEVRLSKMRSNRADRKRGRVMRYEDMPKGRNKDRCVRCGKRYNFADKALSKAKVPYDLLCLAEVTASGYMTHGNVKLCDECMAELLMWLDRKTENSSEKPNNSKERSS